MAKVNVIMKQKDVSIVEWNEDNGAHRSVVRNDMVVSKGGETHVESPEGGIPYGVEWSRIVEFNNVTPEDFQKEMRRRGLWTAEDARNNPNVVMSVLQSLYGLELSVLYRSLAKHEKELKET